ncbi:hypothetical protein [Herbidospora sp. RD11066]
MAEKKNLTPGRIIGKWLLGEGLDDDERRTRTGRTLGVVGRVLGVTERILFVVLTPVVWVLFYPVGILIGIRANIGWAIRRVLSRLTWRLFTPLHGRPDGFRGVDAKIETETGWVGAVVNVNQERLAYTLRGSDHELAREGASIRVDTPGHRHREHGQAVVTIRMPDGRVIRMTTSSVHRRLLEDLNGVPLVRTMPPQNPAPPRPRVIPRWNDDAPRPAKADRGH